ncbi:MAG: ABC transporter ATP-binding protein [Planctomycetota bacterium]|nr:ABC transporter ATP-binding protein [Planctomycetota bacterium]
MAAQGTIADAPPAKKKVAWSQSWVQMRELLVAHKGRLALGFALMLVSRLAGLVLPLAPKVLIDDVIGKQRADLLWPLALAGGAATLVQAGTGYALSQVLGVAAQRAINDMRQVVQAHVARLPVRYFDSTQTGVLISRIMNDAEGIRNLVGTGIVQLVGGIVTAALALFVLFWLHWKLTLVILVVLAAFGGGMAWAFRVLRPLFRERGKITAELTGRLAQTLGGIRVVKAYTAEPAEEAVFRQNAGRLFGNVRRSMTGVSATTSIAAALVGAIGVVVAVVGGRSILAGEMTLGDFVTYLVFIGLVVAPVVSIASVGTQITDAFAGLDRIREVLGVATEDAGDGERESLADVRGEVEFQGVAFEYEAGKPVLQDITFRAAAGSTTALVGSSGSGKSTLVSLVMAFNRPLSGRILVDGRDLERIRLRDWRRHLGIVLQDNFLFDGTIAENVAFARPESTRAEIEESCRLANCMQFVDGFEKGLDTIVGERGVKLSGGQRQRVAIARALLARPRILILDEATSSLDSESEALIQDGLQTLRQSRTTFVIAHRLSTIRTADQILVLEKGRIVERGTHAELLKLGGRYKELHDRQHSLESERFVNPGESFGVGPDRLAVAGPRA